MSHDAIVIGSGPNGLAAANRLADAGWSVLVLEQQSKPGGAVRSARDVHPDFVHDTFSSFYPLAAASRGIQSLHLEDHGLVWERAPAVLGHPLRDGSWGLLHQDRHVTAALAEENHPGDGDAWLELCHQWDAVGRQVVDALLAPFPPVRAGAGALWRIRRAGGLGFVKTLLTPAAELASTRFGGAGLQAIIAGNAAHTDIPLDAPGSGLLGILLSMLGQSVGFPVPRGGAGELTRALTRRLESRGGAVRCGAAVERIGLSAGRARSVVTADGIEYADRAVVACVTAPQLFGDLLAPGDVPPRIREAMRWFTLDPATVKVDWALGGPVPWSNRPAHAPGTVHVADDVADLSRALGQVQAGLVPARPFLLAGQMTTTDATRSPEGTESFWAYTHVPQRVLGDAGEGRITGTWDRSDCERFADRVQDRLEALAPGFGTRVLERRVLGPRELQARNANLLGGAINGGTAQLHQQLVFRPVAGLGRAETGIPGLYLGSASAHPGGGVHGAAGRNAARAALAHARARRVFPRRPRRG